MARFDLPLKNSCATSGPFISHFNALHCISRSAAFDSRDTLVMRGRKDRFINFRRAFPNTFAKRHVKLSSFVLPPPPPLSFSSLFMIMAYNRLPFTVSRGDKESPTPETPPFDLRTYNVGNSTEKHLVFRRFPCPLHYVCCVTWGYYAAI